MSKLLCLVLNIDIVKLIEKKEQCFSDELVSDKRVSKSVLV